MKKIIFTSLAFCLGLMQPIFAQSYSGAESVEFDYANNRYLVSNTTTKQIIARAANGTLSVFATLSIAPYGIEIVGDTLYCCTSTSITALNLNNGSQIFNQVIGTGSVFLNGITHDPAGNLYLTGFSNKKVYRFNTATRQSNIYVNNTVNTPNGIIYDAYDGVNPRLVMAGWGTPAIIKAISLSDSSLTTLVSTPFGNIDGIAKGKNGNFYISCWSNNSIQRYDSTFANTPTAMVTSGLSSPADIFYNHLSDTLAVPIGAWVNLYYFGTTTDLSNLTSSAAILPYPNPSHEFININLPPNISGAIQVKLYEAASGRLVFSENIIDLKNVYSIQIQNHHISSGTYLIELSSSQGVLSKNKITIK